MPGGEFDHVCGNTLGEVLSLGDIDGDGYGDVAIVRTHIYARAHGGTTLDRGDDTSVYFGGLSGLRASDASGTACSFTIPGTMFIEGVVRSAPNDTNGDGYGDLLVSTQVWPAGEVSNYLIESPLDPTAPRPSSFGNGSYSLALSGDFDADGRFEIVIPMEWDVLRSFGFIGGSASSWSYRSYFNRCGSVEFLYTPREFDVLDANDDGYDDLRVRFYSYPTYRTALFTGGPSGLSPDRCTVVTP